MLTKSIARLIAFALVLICAFSQVSAGGKGNKGKGGGENDIIMYNGNIVMRGEQGAGSIVMANNHPTHEEVEFSPSFFGDMSSFGRRR